MMGYKKLTHTCVVCDAEIKRIEGLMKDEPWEGMWGNGIVERISAGYGSVLDGDMFVLAICDDCIKDKKLQYVGNYMFSDFIDEDHCHRCGCNSKFEDGKYICPNDKCGTNE